MARYDGLAEWYDGYITTEARAVTEACREVLLDLLGEGSGRCLDIGCGTGIYLPPVAAVGWQVVGIDLSSDQLAIAHSRAGDIAESLILGDATDLPFSDSSFDAAVSVLTHTDFDDYGAALREAARVLKPGGRFVHVGVHPCFMAASAGARTESGRIHVGPGYLDAGWVTNPVAVGDGVRARAGVNHLPLAELLNLVADAGFRIHRVREALDDPPVLLGVAAVNGL
jgi:SAM-dependent methyltransferase